MQAVVNNTPATPISHPVAAEEQVAKIVAKLVETLMPKDEGKVLNVRVQFLSFKLSLSL